LGARSRRIKTAAPTAIASAAINRSLFTIRKLYIPQRAPPGLPGERKAGGIGTSLAGASQSDKAHNRAEAGGQNKKVEERQNTKNQVIVFSQESKSEHNELNMKEDQANRCKRKPSHGWTKRARSRKAKHSGYQPDNGAEHEHSQDGWRKVSRLAKSLVRLCKH
jgi:hypothetical protein